MPHSRPNRALQRAARALSRQQSIPYTAALARLTPSPDAPEFLDNDAAELGYVRADLAADAHAAVRYAVQVMGGDYPEPPLVDGPVAMRHSGVGDWWDECPASAAQAHYWKLSCE